MEEEWRLERGIWVSDLGAVWGRKSQKRQLPSSRNNAGYALVTVDGSHVPVHQLVAKAFHGAPPDDNWTVDHINGIRDDNRASNLRWASSSTQMKNRSKKRQRADSIGVREAPVIVGERWAEAMGVEVSDHGRLKTKAGHIYSAVADSCTGYCRTRGHFVHKLVANAFLPPPRDPSCTIDHINHDRSDNRASNLRWATPKEQRANRMPLQRPRAVDSNIRKVQMTDIAGYSQIFDSAKDAEAETGVCRTGICAAARGKVPRAGGLYWSYV